MKRVAAPAAHPFAGFFAVNSSAIRRAASRHVTLLAQGRQDYLAGTALLELVREGRATYEERADELRFI